MASALRVLLAAALAATASGALAGTGWAPFASGLRLRGGGIETLAGDTGAPARGWRTERDPVKRKELFNSVPRMNHKDEWQKWKAERMPKKSRGPIWRELRDFACGSVVAVSAPARALPCFAACGTPQPPACSGLGCAPPAAPCCATRGSPVLLGLARAARRQGDECAGAWAGVGMHLAVACWCC